MPQINAGSPESVGIPSFSIEGPLDELKQKQIPMHAFLLARHGKLVIEAYYAPYGPKRLHRMFSVSKGFVRLQSGCWNKRA